MPVTELSTTGAKVAVKFSGVGQPAHEPVSFAKAWLLKASEVSMFETAPTPPPTGART